MSGLSTGIGLISGLDHQALVKQLMAIEARPRDRLMERIAGIQAQKTAYLDISARISALLGHVQSLTSATTFRATSAASSNDNVLTASSAAGTRPGAYQFTVRALATTHQFVTRGFTDRTAPLFAGTLTLESAQARIDRTTSLDALNGYAGVRRGSFRIINEANGQEAVINVTDALTLGDVVTKINAAGIGVQAAIRADGLTIQSIAGGTGGVRVQEIDGGNTAADLGFGPGYTYSATGQLAGTNLMYLSGATPLSALNDGLGLRTAAAGGDFLITVDGQSPISVNLSENLTPDTRLERLNHGQGVRLGQVRMTSKNGAVVTVDLSAAETIGDVQTMLQGAFGDDRIVVTLNGSRLVVQDNFELGENDTEYDFVIEDVENHGHAADDLGISGRATEVRIRGRDILHVDTVADVLAAINAAQNNRDGEGNPIVQAALGPGGHGIVLTNLVGGNLTLAAGTSEFALADIGLNEGTYTDAQIAGARIIGGATGVLLKTLNGGRGFELGTVQITANGTTASLDLTTAETLADVIDLINADTTLGVTAAFDRTGTRIELYNTNGGETAIEVADLSGDFAQTTGLAAADGSTGRLRSDNLQRQYINEGTQLSTLNNGRGVALGTLKITNSVGQMVWINLETHGAETLQDVIDAINDEMVGHDIGVRARINDTGDGLLIEDTTTGDGLLKIEDDSGTAARDLNIRGESATGSLDGTFEYHLSVGPSDTLETLARRISDETTLARATVLNDGTGVAPFRLSITSQVTGSQGELIIDELVEPGGASFGVTTLTRAQDARVLFGGNTGAGVLLTSSSNTFTNVVDGLDLTVSSVSDEPVTVTVGEDIDAVVELLGKLVTDYNAALSRIGEVSDYDEETETRGILQGESALRTVESRLYRMFTRAVTGTGSPFFKLREIGIVADTGGQFRFDEETFRAAWESDREGVISLFSADEKGVAHLMKADLEAITNADGLIDARNDALDGRIDLLQGRVDNLNEQLGRKEARLLRQFQAMETALAQLQSQQSALFDLAASLATTSTQTSG